MTSTGLTEDFLVFLSTYGPRYGIYSLWYLNADAIPRTRLWI